MDKLSIIENIKIYFHSLKLTLFNRGQRKKRLLNAVVLTILLILLYIVGTFIPEGFDWKMYFSKGILHPIWTPWTKWFISIFNYPIIFALSVIAIGLRVFKFKRSVIALALALLSLPTLWVFFMGNLDGLVLLGLLLMPIGVPLALMKPQIAGFAMLAKRSWFIAAVIWLIISLIIFGFWPKNLLMVVQPEWKMEWTQDISLFPWGLIAAIPLLYLSRGDEDLLMAAGSLATPHLFPYHFIILMPSLARMKWYWMIITWIVSWTPLLANYFGNWAWHFGNLLSACFWLGIVLSNESIKIRVLSDLKKVLNWIRSRGKQTA